MKELLRLVFAALTLTARVAVGDPATIDGNWHAVTTAGITVISDANPGLTEQYARELERFGFHLPAVAPELTIHPDAPPLLVYLFTRRGEYTPLKDCRRCAGTFVQSPYRNYIAIDLKQGKSTADGASASLRYLYHEFVHYAIRNRNAEEKRRYYPPWLEEGQAELFSSLSLENEVIRVGSLRDDAWLMNLSKSIPVESMLKSRATPHRGHDGARFYNHAWVLYRYFRSGDDRRRQLDAYVARLNEGVNIDSAFRQTFNTDYAGFEKRLETYLALVERAHDQPRFMYRYYTPAGTFDPPPAAARSLSRAETAYYLASLLFQTGDATPETVRELFEASINAAPDLYLGYLGLARHFMDRGRAVKAQFYINRALERAPDDSELLALHADNLLIQAVDAHNRYKSKWRALAERARAQYRRALEHDEGNTAARLGLGYYHALFSHNGESAALGEGVEALHRVRSVLPNPIIDLMLGQLESRRGHSARARQHLERVAAWSTSSAVLSRAEDALADLNDEP